jgi:nicotinamide riboside transporter PnuC
MTWALTILSIVGVILNIKKNRLCFWIWGFTNGAWCVVDFHYGFYAQASLFLIYFVLAIYGIVSWRNEKPPQNI